MKAGPLGRSEGVYATAHREALLPQLYRSAAAESRAACETDAGYRTETQRTLPVACSAVNSTSLSLKIDVRSNGRAALGNRTGATPPRSSLHGVMYLL